MRRSHAATSFLCTLGRYRRGAARDGRRWHSGGRVVGGRRARYARVRLPRDHERARPEVGAARARAGRHRGRAIGAAGTADPTRPRRGAARRGSWGSSGGSGAGPHVGPRHKQKPVGRRRLRLRPADQRADRGAQPLLLRSNRWSADRLPVRPRRRHTDDQTRVGAHGPRELPRN